jgi:uncharacterized protein YlxW (UPF0749 family)
VAWDPTQPSRVPQSYGRSDLTQRPGGPANLADILERVLDKGIVIAGDIQINLLDIELLTIKLRLLVASVERAQEMGINWWETDPTLSRAADALDQENRQLETANRQLESQNDELRERLDRLEKAIEERTNGSDGT